MGRTAAGVRGIRLSKMDQVIGAVIVNEETSLLTVTENGYGKRSLFEDYRLQYRGGKGVINIKASQRNGKVVSIKEIHEDEELMIITRYGVVIRMPSDNIRVIGRNAQGVRLINLDDEDQVIDITRLMGQQDDEDEGDEVEETTVE